MTDQDKLREPKSLPRVFFTTDISNEPDDSESFVRYLLYSNEFRTEGLVPCTSTHQRTFNRPDLLRVALRGYAQVVDNLNVHTHPSNRYPDPLTLYGLIKCGSPVYGMLALEPGCPLAGGTKLLVERTDASQEPLWVLCWGGSNVIAQALQHGQRTRSSHEIDMFCSKIRLYLISEQDDTGPWIRTHFPRIFLICSIHSWSQYMTATWWGMACPEDGVDSSQFKQQWLRENIQLGPLGRTYPDPCYQIEGDTPSFLYLIPNGLGCPEQPLWSRWGGRYQLVDLWLRSQHYSDALDRVVGKDGKVDRSNFATLWRWADAFQNDFAARIQWSLKSDISQANHQSVVIVNDDTNGTLPLVLGVEAGHKVCLDASRSYDPDGDNLTFTWFHYHEPTIATGVWDVIIPRIDIVSVDEEIPGRKVELEMPPPEVCGIDYKSGQPQKLGHTYHFVLEVEDNGTPSMTTYKRVIVQTTNENLRGSRDPLPRVAHWEHQIMG